MGLNFPLLPWERRQQSRAMYYRSGQGCFHGCLIYPLRLLAPGISLWQSLYSFTVLAHFGATVLLPGQEGRAVGWQRLPNLHANPLGGWRLDPAELGPSRLPILSPSLCSLASTLCPDPGLLGFKVMSLICPQNLPFFHREFGVGVGPFHRHS